MASKTLSISNIKSAKAGDVLYDDKIGGLQLKINAKSKSFCLYYRTRDGMERRPKIGNYPEMTIFRARDIARDIKDRIAGGHDVSGDWKKAKQDPLVSDLCDRFEEYFTAKWRSEKSISSGKSRIEKIIKPKIGKMKVKDVTDDDIDGIHKSMVKSPYAANRTLSLLSRMFSMAEKWKMRPQATNPAFGIERFKEKKRRRFMNGAEAPLITAELEKRKKNAPKSVLFIYLLILTGARKSEIANAKWSQIKGNRIFDLGENKTQDDRSIYLPAPAMEIIEQLPKTSDTITGIQDPKSVWNAVRTAAGCPDLRMHDLRRTYASAALSSGFGLDQIGELLRHRNKSTTDGYSYMMEGDFNAAAEATALKLRGMLDGEKRPALKVVK